ncbi:MAG: hypothetical protein ACOYLO_00670 [Ferruginibacter sp.]
MNKKNDDFVLSLVIPISTIIDQRHIDYAYREAMDCELGSIGRKAFIAYAEELKRKLEHQRSLE